MTTCRCGRRWTGLGEAHCATCHRHFGSVASFDKHRVKGECADPSELFGIKSGKALLVPVERASGLVWVAPGGSDRWAS